MTLTSKMDDRALTFESSSRTSGLHGLKSPSSQRVDDSISAIKMVDGTVPFLLDFQDCKEQGKYQYQLKFMIFIIKYHLSNIINVSKI